MAKSRATDPCLPCPACQSHEMTILRLREEIACQEHDMQLLQARLQQAEDRVNRAKDIIIHIMQEQVGKQRGKGKGTEERYAAICQLRNSDKEKWTWGQLKNKFDLGSPNAARIAYNRHMQELREYIEAEVTIYGHVIPDHRTAVARQIIRRILAKVKAAGAFDLLTLLPDDMIDRCLPEPCGE